MLSIPMMGYFTGEMVSVTLNKGAVGSNVNGVWVPGAPTTEPIHIFSPQPVKANDLVNLADGEHLSDFVKSWSADLTIYTRDGTTDPDTIEWDGNTYEVTQVNKRKLGVYRKFFMKRVG